VHHVLANRRGGRGTYAPLKELAERIKRPPYEWTPDGLWQAYVVAKMAAAQPGMQHGVTELISLIRYELGADAELRPYCATIEERFQAWLLKQEQARVQFTPAQMWWLERIRDVIATSAELNPEDLDHVPFTERGGTDGFEATFGPTRAAKLIDELDQELTA
jgi:type I restriction enzyme R subunit